MLNGPTAIVLGAGSSVKFGLPTGMQLSQRIQEALNFELSGSELVSGDEIVFEAARLAMPASRERIVPASKDMVAALPYFNSIDDFLHTHGDQGEFKVLGKLAIARIIAEAENDGLMRHLEDVRVNPGPSVGRALRGSWIDYLMRLLVTGVDRRAHANVFENITIVDFNYDRCAEVGLYFSVMNALRLSPQEARATIKNLHIYHPYGFLGELPETEFGPTRDKNFQDPRVISEMASQIKVYTEEMAESAELVKIRGRLAGCTNAVFLGFACHAQNMELLKHGRDARGLQCNTFASAFGEESPAISRMVGKIKEVFGVLIEPRTQVAECEEFLRRYSPSLAA